MPKRSKRSKHDGSHAALKSAIMGAALAGALSKRKKPSRIEIQGGELRHRMDRPRRASGGKVGGERINVIVGQPSGVAPPLSLMRPPVGPMAAPVAGAGQRISGRSDGALKGSFANHQGGVSGSASFARGGAVGAVSHGESLNQIRKRTQS